MDADPTSVVKNAVEDAIPILHGAGELLSTILLTQLAKDLHYAEFEIQVKAVIVDPQTNDEVGKMEWKQPYHIYPGRNPQFRDRTE